MLSFAAVRCHHSRTLPGPYQLVHPQEEIAGSGNRWRVGGPILERYGAMKMQSARSLAIAMIILGLCSPASAQLVPVGALSHEEIHTPGIFVDRVVQVERHPRVFEPPQQRSTL